MLLKKRPRSRSASVHAPGLGGFQQPCLEPKFSFLSAVQLRADCNAIFTGSHADLVVRTAYRNDDTRTLSDGAPKIHERRCLRVFSTDDSFRSNNVLTLGTGERDDDGMLISSLIKFIFLRHG